MLPDYQKLGAFYLGKRKDDGGLLLYDSSDLVTHAVCVGMTGSGKTGLCMGLLEEAAIDGIPAIVIDPRGDLGNLMLQFPNFAPDCFPARGSASTYSPVVVGAAQIHFLDKWCAQARVFLKPSRSDLQV
jgi:hypothetical protein